MIPWAVLEVLPEKGCENDEGRRECSRAMSSMYVYKYLKEGKRCPGSFQWCPVTGPKVEPWKIPHESKEQLSLL